ncbi:peroxiredoxin-like family protein [Aurantiacibacter spongiae]|uniref:AhpC/TSA family protein n=1 Tax=Aurantiacibacter spongiae TaxID=2488860 RepID=A0A3N5DF41_9SPHN|nr:peroxiredoxin-like family protein [Aurantiacibacter spongiae]RPF70272.1 AhpC/TSA family protein [Aurantiacibacter spongiae]
MLKPNQPAPAIDLPLTIQAKFVLADQSPDLFTWLIFYRGRHCPVCKSYLEEIGSRLDEITGAGLSPFAISMDDKDRAMTVDSDWKTGDLPLVYDLSEDKAREYGLYISQKREGTDEPDVFSEPGMFLIRPDGTVYMAQVQSAPFTRPSIDQLLDGVKVIKDKDYPARGTRT